METQVKTNSNAKDFFINLGAVISLYTLVISLLNLLFTIINTIYPQISNGYGYIRSESISWPVAILVITFPIFILLMWLMEKGYKQEPESKNRGIHKWLTYITLFTSGFAIAGGLITVLYYFLDGQELTTGFLLKVLALLIVTSSVFIYYITDVLNKLTSKSRVHLRFVAGVVVLASIIWGFSVLGSPATQRLYKYDEQKVSDLINLRMAVENYYITNEELPDTIYNLDVNHSYFSGIDPQTQESYEYRKIDNKNYELCAEFNTSNHSGINAQYSVGVDTWVHEEGRQCFVQPTVNINSFLKPLRVR